MTEQEIEAGKREIDAMSQEKMARLRRFTMFGHPFFDRANPLGEYFRLKFEGFTPKLSKKIGW